MEVKNREIGDVLASALGTRRDTAKWTPPFDFASALGTSRDKEKGMVPFDPAHRICVSTLSKDGLTVGRDMAKRTPPFDSAHQICQSTLSKDVLIVDQGVCRWRFKHCEIGHILLPLWEPTCHTLRYL